MSILYPNSLPKSVFVDDVEYSIRSEYYIVLEIIRIIGDTELDEQTKMFFILDLFFVDDVPEDLQLSYTAIINFIDKASWSNGYKRKYTDDTEVMSWEIDAPFIFASMKQAYPYWDWSNAHWWEFKACFDSLPDNAKINEIIKLRSMKITSDMSPDIKRDLLEVKKVYALPKKQQAEHKTAKQLEEELIERAKVGD